jgi:hypothetical protein
VSRDGPADAAVTHGSPESTTQDRPSARDNRIVQLPAGETNTSTRWPLLDNPSATRVSPKLSLSKATKSDRLAHGSTAPAAVVNATVRLIAAKRMYRSMSPSFWKAVRDHRRTKGHYSCGDLGDGRSVRTNYVVLEAVNIKGCDSLSVRRLLWI